MIVGIGTDICDARRIEKSMARFGERFLNRIFTASERQYCDEKSGRANYYAKRFAAKEAVAKALAGPDTGALRWHDVEIENEPSGRPRVILRGEARQRLSDYDQGGFNWTVHLSLSDDPPYAIAFAVIEANRL